MAIKMLDERVHIDPLCECRCRYVRSDTEYFRLHYHNYYEFFMIVKGNVCHLINSKKQLLKEGQLLFIRDFDVHDYASADGNSFEFVNFAFSKSAFDELCAYLGEGFKYKELLEAKMPPSVYLSRVNREQLLFRLTELNSGAEEVCVKTKMRILIMDIFAQYFFNYSEKRDEIPSWLEITYEKMKNPRNFIAGIDKMYEISGKSREHLSRSLKNYYGVTPSELIADLRLEYAVNLLLTSNLSVTDICFESGFENLSWFYKQFGQKYGETPADYRKNAAEGR